MSEVGGVSTTGKSFRSCVCAAAVYVCVYFCVCVCLTNFVNHAMLPTVGDTADDVAAATFFAWDGRVGCVEVDGP